MNVDGSFGYKFGDVNEDPSPRILGKDGFS
jgi:hypothetical protein